jgi:hypothetical protein
VQIRNNSRFVLINFVRPDQFSTSAYSSMCRYVVSLFSKPHALSTVTGGTDVIRLYLRKELPRESWVGGGVEVGPEWTAEYFLI